MNTNPVRYFRHLYTHYKHNTKFRHLSSILLVGDLDGTFIKTPVNNVFLELGNDYRLEKKEIFEDMGEKRSHIKRLLMKSDYKGFNMLNYNDQEELVNSEYLRFENKLLNSLHLSEFLPNTKKYLEKMINKGCIVTATTGFNRKSVDIIRNFLFNKNFEFPIISSDDVTYPKPEPDGINIFNKIYNEDRLRQVVKVGDTQIDMEEGRNAIYDGLDVITVWMKQYSMEDSVQGNDYTVENISELYKLLDNSSSSSASSSSSSSASSSASSSTSSSTDFMQTVCITNFTSSSTDL